MEQGGDEAMLEFMGVGGISSSELVLDISLVSEGACSRGTSANIFEALSPSCQQPKPQEKHKKIMLKKTKKQISKVLAMFIGINKQKWY